VIVFILQEILKINSLQDAITEIFFSIIIGYIIYLHIELYNIHPLLVCIPIILIFSIGYVLTLSNKSIIDNIFLKLQSQIMKSDMNNIRSSSKYRLSDDYDNNNNDNFSSYRQLENNTDYNRWEVNIDNNISSKNNFQSIQRHRRKLLFSSLKILTDDLSLHNVDEVDDFRDNKLDHHLIVHSIEDNNSVQYSISSDVTNSFSNSSLSDDNSEKCSFEKESDDDDNDNDDDRPLCRIAQLEPIPSFMNFNYDINRTESRGNFAYFNDV
jgi:hypothetical protein